MIAVIILEIHALIYRNTLTNENNTITPALLFFFNAFANGCTKSKSRF